MRISASLVLYHNAKEKYGLAIKDYLQGCDGLLYVIDNSVPSIRDAMFHQRRIQYTELGRNIGFGSAHNVAISQIGLGSDVHLFLNPDVRFEPHVLPRLLECFERQNDLSVLMPQIVYPNGELQRLCKLLPNPVDLILRRYLPFRTLRDRVNCRYELHGLDQDSQSDVPSLSGCFLLVRTNVLQKVGGFDERFFMYMEDVDLVRRLSEYGRTVYAPFVSVIHDYAKGSYRNKRLMHYHIRSAILYFNKWGWIRDAARTRTNRWMLDSL